MSIEMLKRTNDGVCYFETTVIGDNELSRSHSVMVFQAWKRKCVPILLIALSFLFHLNVYPVSGHAADRPNIVFILADDLGYGDIKAFGGSRCNIDTPHFDKVCADGLRFTDAHVTDSVCIPSRTSMMTGRACISIRKS